MPNEREACFDRYGCSCRVPHLERGALCPNLLWLMANPDTDLIALSLGMQALLRWERWS